MIDQGLVEKWLKEVQTIMLDSMLTQMKAAYDNCWTSNHPEWIVRWCGQIVQTISCAVWTKEVRVKTICHFISFCAENALDFDLRIGTRDFHGSFLGKFLVANK